MKHQRLSIGSFRQRNESNSISRSLAALIVAVVACTSGPAWAAGTYYVDINNPSATDGGPGTEAIPYRSISAADRKHGGPGTTINVKAGTYHEEVTVNWSGTAAQPYVIRAIDSQVIIDCAEDFSNKGLWTSGPGNAWSTTSVHWDPVQVFVDGVRLTKTVDDPSIMAANTFNYVFAQGLYVNLGGDNPGSHDIKVGFHQNGFRLTNRSYVTIANFQVLRGEEDDIYSLNSSNITVHGNRLNFAAHHGVAVQNGSAVVVDSNVVSFNADHGINFLSNVTNSVVQDNESSHNARGFERAANGLFLFASSNNLIQRNRFHDNEDSGIEFTNGSNDNVSLQNISWKNGDHGYDHIGSTGTLQIGDVAWGNVDDGISVEGSSGGTQNWNCISVNNGMTTGRFDVYVDSSSTSGYQSNYNIIYNSVASAKPIKYNGVQYLSLAAFSGATGLEGQSFQSDPRFVDPANADFHLRSGSKAIDSGNSSIPNWPMQDAEGVARVDDPVSANTGIGPITYADRGALEFVRTGSVGVEDPTVVQVLLGPAFPNPGRGTVSFALELAHPGMVEWMVTDVLGRVVWEDAANLSAGRALVRWAGVTSRGKRVPAGIYMIRLGANGETLTRRFAVVH